MKRSLVGVMLACLLTSCVSKVKPDFEMKADSSKGVMIVSVTASGSIPGGLVFKFRTGGTGGSLQPHTIQLFAHKDEIDWPVLKSAPDQPAGRLAILELPPGQYEFYLWAGHAGGMSVSNATEFSKRFEIRASEVVYLGNLHLKRARGEQMFTLFTGDRRDRDFPLLATKLPNVPPEKIAVRLLK